MRDDFIFSFIGWKADMKWDGMEGKEREQGKKPEPAEDRSASFVVTTENGCLFVFDMPECSDEQAWKEAERQAKSYGKRLQSVRRIGPVVVNPDIERILKSLMMLVVEAKRCGVSIVVPGGCSYDQELGDIANIKVGAKR